MYGALECIFNTVQVSLCFRCTYRTEKQSKFQITPVTFRIFFIICSIITMIVEVSEEMCQSVNNKKKCKYFYTDHIREVRNIILHRLSFQLIYLDVPIHP